LGGLQAHPQNPHSTNLEEEEIVDAPGNDSNAPMPEQVKRPNPRMMTMMMMMVMTPRVPEKPV
jgi:hypothetical protein